MVVRHPSASGSETQPSASRLTSCKDEEDLWRFHWPSDPATDAVSHHLPHSTDAKGLKPGLEECRVILASNRTINKCPIVKFRCREVYTSSVNIGDKQGNDLKCHKSS